METATAQQIQLPTQGGPAAAPVAGPAVGPADPFVAETAVPTPALLEPATAAPEGWGSDLLLAGVLLLLVLLALAATRILRLTEALRVAQQDELAAIGEARELRRRLAEAAASRRTAAEEERVRLENSVAGLTRQRDELERTNRLLQGMVRCDAVTGLANGPYFARQLAKELRRAMRTRQALSLIVCDVDAFAAYNRRHGHEQGDALLRRVGALLGAHFQRGGDLAARLDGDRFAVMMPETSGTDAEGLAARLERAIGAAAIPHGDSPHGPTVSVSVGVATTTSNRLLHPHQLLAAAEEAKTRGRRAAGKLPATPPVRRQPAAGAKGPAQAPRASVRGGKAKGRKTRAKAAAGTTPPGRSRPKGAAPEPAADVATEEAVGVSGALFPEQATGGS